MTKGHYLALPIGIIAALALALTVGPFAQVASAEAPAALKQLDEAFVQVAEKVTPAVVNISSTKKMAREGMGGDLEPFFRDHPFRDFFGDEFFKKFKKDPGQGREFKMHGMGSGLIVTPDGIILTNAHVVKDADEITVTLSDKRSHMAKVIGIDPESDVAVIKIDAKGLPIAKFGNSDKLRVGEIVMAIGNPFGLNQTVTSGIVSAKGRSNMGIIGYEHFIQTDAAINPGNSGGPLVNIEGEVIGLNTAIASRSGGYQGIGFAIPSNAAKLIMDELISRGSVRRGLLGVKIQDVTEDLAKSFGLEDTSGALVSQVIPGTPAETAGVKSGDIIVKFNGVKVGGASELKNMVGKERPDSTATLTIIRNKKTMDLTVKVGERTPQIASETKSSGEAATSNELGVEVDKVPAATAAKMGLKEGEGLQVKEINANGSGRKLGLRVGDVILEVDGTPISDVATFNKKTAEAKKNKLIRLKIQRGNDVRYLASSI